MAKKGMIINENYYGLLPVIPLRNTLVLPFTITPLLVGRVQSIRAAEASLVGERQIICVSQKQLTEYDESPKAKNLYRLNISRT